MKIGSVNVEEFSRNLARLIEEGGRALAAYLKPREEGRKGNELAEEVGEVVKTLGQVAEYWLEDPQRALEAQNRLGKAYLDLWASAAKRLTGEEIVTIRGLTELSPRRQLTIEMYRPSDGRIARFPVRCRIDTPTELEYYKNGGVLHYVLRSLAA